MRDRRSQLIEELRDKSYRETYAEQHVNSILAAQIATVREQRGMRQADLAKLMGKQQPAVSRAENVNYSRWSVKNLREFASALGCWLNIRLESWGSLVDDVESSTIESLRRDSFEDDPLFYGSRATENVPEPVRWMQKKLLPWLTTSQDSLQLARWLQGLDMPPFGDLDPPYTWITRAVEVEPANSPYRAKLVEHSLDLLNQALIIKTQAESSDDVLAGIFSLLTAFPLSNTWNRLKEIHENPALNSAVPQAAHSTFLTALIRNQLDDSLKNEWLTTIKTGCHRWLIGANELDGFEGLKWIQCRPNIAAIAEGFNALYVAKYLRPHTGLDFTDLMEDLKETFHRDKYFGLKLWFDGQRAGWQSIVIRAWSTVFGHDYADEIPMPPSEFIKKMPAMSSAIGASRNSDAQMSSRIQMESVAENEVPAGH